MGLYKYLREAWKKPETLKENQKERLIKWRKEGSTVRIKRPTKLHRARALGYKAKQGYVLVRQSVKRGGHKRPMIKKGRRPKHYRQRMVLDKSYQTIAQERTAKKYPNCEVLNSYSVGKDGKTFWFEIILVDKQAPEIKADKRINWICEKQHTRRVFRGKTSASRKTRGLRHKGKGAEKLRPSKKAVYRKKYRSQRKYKPL